MTPTMPPAATAAATEAATPSTAATPPTAAGDLPVTTVDFTCRLPVVTVDPAASGPDMHGGFISFPSARLVDDPNGAMMQRAYPTDDFATTASPVLYGGGGGFYDRAAGRWVPSPPGATLPDGSAYAYVTSDLTLDIVNVATGKVRMFDVRSLDRPTVMDFDARGVYLSSPSALGGPGEGVSLLDPTTGAIKQLGAVHQVWAVRDGKAWVARLDPRDKTAWTPMELPPADSLVQVDLATGAETIWFYRAGAYPWMIGMASGRPLINVLGNGSEVRVLDGPGSDGELIYSGSLVFDGYPGNYQGDGDRVWLGSERGIYLYRPGRALQKVFAFNVAPSSGGDMHPAGFCL